MSEANGQISISEEVQENVPNVPSNKESRETEESKLWIPPDGGYGWLVVLASFLLWFEYGHVWQAGIFMLRIAPEFNVTNTEFGGLNSVQGAVGPLLGMFIGSLVQAYGCRPVVLVGTVLISVGYFSSAFVYSFPVLYITYGILPSLAIGIFYCCAVVSVNQYFMKRGALANALALTGWNASTFAWPPFGSWLTVTVGWRDTFLIQAAIHCIIGGIMVALLKPPGKRNTFCLVQSISEKNKAKKKTFKEKLFNIVDFTPLTNFTLVVYLIGMFLFLIGHTINIVYIPVRSELLDIDPETASLHAAVLGIVVSVVTLVFSPVGDLKYVNRGLVFAIANLVAAILTLVSITLSTSTHFYIYGAVLGLVQGIYMAVDVAFFVDVCGLELLPAASGWYTVICALAPLTLHPLVGVLLDETEDPHSPFILAGGAQVLCSILFGFVTWRLKTAKEKELNPETSGVYPISTIETFSYTKNE